MQYAAVKLRGVVYASGLQSHYESLKLAIRTVCPKDHDGQSKLADDIDKDIEPIEFGHVAGSSRFMFNDALVEEIDLSTWHGFNDNARKREYIDLFVPEWDDVKA